MERRRPAPLHERFQPRAAVPPPTEDAPEGRGFGFQDLVRHRVHDVLLVASPYESFVLAEDGQPQALMLREFLELNLQHIPGFHHVPSGAAALALPADRPRPDLVIASTHLGDMDGAELARRLHEQGVTAPVVLLAFDAGSIEGRSLHPAGRGDGRFVDRVFLWQGDARLFIAIVKYIEDRLNVAHDTGRMAVQAILLIEDSVRQYSSFLPVVLAEVLAQSRRLVPEGLNLAHKLLRFQARPKILLCSSFEEAEGYFQDYQENVLGVISDVEFPKDGRPTADAGVQFARMVRAEQADVPIILHSRDPAHRADAAVIGASFLLKGSPVLLQELRALMTEYFSFGDFVFRLADGREVDRAGDLKSFEERLRTVPDDSLAYHARRNHFSRWLKARTEFAVAQRLRPRKVSDFATIGDLRRTLIGAIQEYRKDVGRATVSDFDPDTFDAEVGFARLRGGSLGGKARGLAFVNLLLSEHRVGGGFAGVRVAVPPSLVLATEVFDDFLRQSGLREWAMSPPPAGAGAGAGGGDDELRRRFLAAPFPAAVERDLWSFLRSVRVPLAVRSSSLLEDSMFQPFAGIYDTVMIANDHPDLGVRLRRLVAAIKRIYASTFSRRAQAYFEATSYRLEEEKMAVLVQCLVGARHGDRFYPDFAGVARSHNDYAVPPLAAGDGIAAVALGFGEAVVGGERCLRFSPRHPARVLQLSSAADAIATSQRSFHALQLGGGGAGGEGEGDEGDAEGGDGSQLRSFPLAVAELDGTLDAVGSTYSPENDAVYDGISRPGVRLVSFAPVLKHGLFPLAEVLDRLLAIGVEGIGGPVEIEFAVNLSAAAGNPREFGFLQLRPLASAREASDIEVGEVPAERVLCRSGAVLGHGRRDDIRDIVAIDRDRFERARSVDIAAEVARFNADLVAAGRPYLLVGVGRWGSRDPLLGIPVGWEQIRGARVIVEAGLRDLRVSPSQGTHFFQNLTAASVGYFTVNPELGDGYVDWDWLRGQPASSATAWVRHIVLPAPLVVVVNGRRHEGVVLKPAAPPGAAPGDGGVG